MFDDLDPDFISSPGAALPIVAARVYAIRKRRMIVVAGVCGTILVFMFAQLAFGGGGGKPDRLSVVNQATTTTEESPSNVEAPLVTAPTTAATSTTIAASTTTATLPIAADTTTTSPETTTTTVPSPAHLTVSFDRDRLVIQSGTKATITYTVTNDGGRPGGWGYIPERCIGDRPVWPDDESRVIPVAWPVPVDHYVICQPLTLVNLGPQDSVSLQLTLVAGLSDSAGHVVPAPPGETTFVLRNEERPGAFRLPVTITPPATAPLTIEHPSEVTTATGTQHWVDLTITNNLPFSVRYTDQGPCSADGDAPCTATTADGSFTGDVRVPPYATAVKPLYLTTFSLGAHESRTVRAAVYGTTNLQDSSTGSSDLPPGVYYFDWDGEKVKFTVTP